VWPLSDLFQRVYIVCNLSRQESSSADEPSSAGSVNERSVSDEAVEADASAPSADDESTEEGAKDEEDGKEADEEAEKDDKPAGSAEAKDDPAESEAAEQQPGNDEAAAEAAGAPSMEELHALKKGPEKELEDERKKLEEVSGEAVQEVHEKKPKWSSGRDDDTPSWMKKPKSPKVEVSQNQIQHAFCTKLTVQGLWCSYWCDLLLL